MYSITVSKFKIYPLPFPPVQTAENSPLTAVKRRECTVIPTSTGQQTLLQLGCEGQRIQLGTLAADLPLSVTLLTSSLLRGRSIECIHPRGCLQATFGDERQHLLIVHDVKALREALSSLELHEQCNGLFTTNRVVTAMLYYTPYLGRRPRLPRLRDPQFSYCALASFVVIVS